MTRKISLFSLVLLVIAAIDSIRNLPSSALFGPALIFFFIFSAIVFLFPTSLVAAELSAAFPEKGGVYHWVLKAFGEKTAMFAIWLQWINTMVWYPTILSFVAGTAAYLINPNLAQNEVYLVVSILIVFWGLTLINLFGLRTSARFNGICVLVGTIFPLILLVVLGAIWFFSSQPLQIQITSKNVFPSLSTSSSWVSLIAITAGFLGMELSGVHVNDIKNPQKNFPRAILYSSLFILLSMMFGALAIALCCPPTKSTSLQGSCRSSPTSSTVFHMQWCIPHPHAFASCRQHRRDDQLAHFPCKRVIARRRIWFHASFLRKKKSPRGCLEDPHRPSGFGQPLLHRLLPCP